VTQGLSQLIGREPDLEVCACASDAATALGAIAALKPDAAIVDLSLGNASGLQLVKDCKVRHPGLPILVLSMHDESLYAERALRAGAKGYVMKKEPPERVLAALRRVLGGAIALSDGMATRLLQGIVAARPVAPGSLLDLLSDRELEVFEHIGRGAATQQIAETLHLSPKTVETHRAHIKEKLQLRGSTELLLHAMQWVQNV
jgi:DNA-binding NarL/FixJ family response regulator